MLISEVNLKEMTRSLSKLAPSGDLLDRLKKVEAASSSSADTADLRTRIKAGLWARLDMTEFWNPPSRKDRFRIQP